MKPLRSWEFDDYFAFVSIPSMVTLIIHLFF